MPLWEFCALVRQQKANDDRMKEEYKKLER